MIWKPRRKNSYAVFSFKTRIVTSLLLAILFILGFWITLPYGAGAVILYLALWILSYVVIFAGTCRYCVYYGKSCPVPLEGGCVPYFFKYGGEKFGFLSLLWASVSYLLRVALPGLIIFKDGLWLIGGFYLFFFVLFWAVHFLFSGCPNCINKRCPLNPDYGRS
jgi:hypothetical protein